MSDKNAAPPSTLQSYVDSATGAVQSALGSLTGNTADQVRISLDINSSFSLHSTKYFGDSFPNIARNLPLRL
jgi:hypothetical protein